MDRNYIDGENVIERYVQGRLSEAELVEFELYYLENPATLDEVALARALKAGLAEQPAPPQATQRMGWLDTVGSWFQSPLVLVGNFAVIALLVVFSLQDSLVPVSAVTPAQRYWLGELRGGQAALQIEMRTASIVLDIDVIGSGNYQVNLLDEQANSVSYSSRVKAEAGTLLVVLSTADIAPGNYTLQVVNPAGEVELSRDLRLSLVGD